MKLAAISGVKGVYTDQDIAKVVALAKKARLTWKGTGGAARAKATAKKTVAKKAPAEVKPAPRKPVSKPAAARKVVGKAVAKKKAAA
jgi:hypothetical protein